MKFKRDDKVIAVVVTYNRKELLKECLDAILRQSYSVYKIIVIDNCSTDGTEKELKQLGYCSNPAVEYVRQNKNTGGAGGFCKGIKCAEKFPYDWIWLMDDDTIPTEDCLEKLVEAMGIIGLNDGTGKQNKVSYFASAVYGSNGECMNVPKVNLDKAPNGYPFWYKFLDKSIVRIKMATFVSLLVNRRAVEKCGLPCSDFFIWGDDSEYTTRLAQFYGNAYLVGNSVAIHKRATTNCISLKQETNIQRIGMFHYKYRNEIIINRYYETKYHMPIQVMLSMLSSLRYIGKQHGIKKAGEIIKGNIQGIVQYQRFKNYIDGQISEK